jgi:ABC-type sugar transport system substrate-binding protein
MKRLFTNSTISIVIITLAASLMMPGLTYGEQKYRIALFAQRSEGDAFWTLIENFMQAACHDLGMELTIYYAHDSRPKMKANVQKATEGANKADALVFPNHKNVAYQLIEIAGKAEIPAILINSGVVKENQAKVGKPREKFSSWIGQVLSDDEGAGFQLANILIDTAKKQGKIGPDGKIHVIGITGTVSDTAAVERSKGLKRAIQGRDDAVLHQIVPANWDQADAKQRVVGLMDRYAEHQVSVLWTASDLMSIGAAEGAEELNLVPGQDIFTGGVDWTNEGVEAVKSGTMLATMGGHFMEGGWAAVLLYDYFHGADFAEEFTEMLSPMMALTKDNIDAYIQFSQSDWEQIDFTKFSKKLNPELQKYDFSFDAIMKQF